MYARSWGVYGRVCGRVRGRVYGYIRTFARPSVHPCVQRTTCFCKTDFFANCIGSILVCMCSCTGVRTPVRAPVRTSTRTPVRMFARTARIHTFISHARLCAQNIPPKTNTPFYDSFSFHKLYCKNMLYDYIIIVSCVR